MKFCQSIVALFLVVTVLVGEASALVFPGVETVNAESYALANGQTLTVSIDGSADQTITFASADFSAIGSATAEEVAAVLKRDLSGAFCYSSNSETTVVIETAAAGSSASVQVTGGTANAALGFPTTESNGNWVPMTQAIYGIGDPDTDGSNNGREIIGCDKDDPDDAGSICDPADRNEDLPAVYIYNDGTSFVVRMRLDNNPEQSAGNLRPYGWGLLLDTDGDYADFEYSLMADGIGSTEVVEFAQNTDKTGVGDPSDGAELSLYSDTWTDEENCGSWGCGNGKVNIACDAATESCFSNNDDYFLDYAVPLWYLTDQPDIDLSTSITFWAGTSNNARTITVDLANTTSGPTAGSMLCTGSNPTSLGGCTPVTAAKVENNVAETFDLSDGDTLTVEIDGGGVQTVTFDTLDFVDITAATAAEVVDAINAELVGAVATATSGGTHVTITSDTIGSTSTVEVTGGTANVELEFCATKMYGTDGDSDSDGDGSCAFEDCDDSNADNYPGNTEVCDGIDNNCDDTVDEGFDSDSDGYKTCGADGIAGNSDDDCNDGVDTIYPGQTESCDAIDNDCDSTTDEGFDGDSDGYTTCGADGIAGNADDDCNDGVDTIYPGQTESCDAIDNDCDGTTDEGFDGDSDGYTTCGADGVAGNADDDCNDGVDTIYPGQTESCDAIDNDCDGTTDEGFDGDSDGYTTCGADGVAGNADDDCNDGVDTIYPGQTETCDAVDNDCDGTTDEGFDGDSDGYTTCGADGVAGNADDDCNDGVDTIYPGQTETCDAIDNDCDGATDEGFDGDSDGYTTCGADGVAGNADDDCNDGVATIYPGQTESCDAIDNDCDGTTDEGFDGDSDGYTTCGADGVAGNADDDCNDGVDTIYPGQTESCDAIDNDCDGATDEGFDGDSDGYTTCGADGVAGNADDDCNDGVATIYPGQTESCDAIDNDCDGATDEGFDGDSDGYTTCGADGVAGNADDDCNDGVDTIYPGQTETCDAVDNDCDGTTDEGFDGDSDGYTTCGADGVAGNSDDDCNDGVDTIYPGQTETCDAVDNDCDGTTDEGFDGDSDGYTTCGADGVAGNADDDCNDGVDTIYPGQTESCDAIDNDCDGATDEGFDGDSDGYTTCGADGVAGNADDDCNDGVDTIYPGQTESCDAIDNDCDGTTDEGFDGDSDGFTTCGADGVAGNADDDCNDGVDTIYPGQTEICDAVDNDCDGATDEGFDGDSDGFTTCGADGVAGNADDDCNDGVDTIYPGQTESCDAIDNDCDGTTDEGFDGDSDGFTTCGADGVAGNADDDCNDGVDTIYPGQTEICDAVDNDCDGATDEGFDGDSDGFTTCGADGVAGNADDDCNDGVDTIYPGQTETCDVIDNDCDGTTDEGFDGDSDGFTTCGADGVAGNADDDCNDGVDTIYPGQTEVCDAIDNDCDGTTDEDFDGDSDGYTTCGADGVAGNSDDDCNDSVDTIYPGQIEVCDAIDNDCDGATDEGFDDDGDGVTTCGKDGIPGTSDDDCDDDDENNFPGNVELCDGLDNDCDTLADNDLDRDDDGVLTCGPDGVPGNEDDDCDDYDENNFPGNPELCDGSDNNCDSQVDEGFDNDEDSVTTCGPDGIPSTSDDDCDDNDADNFPLNPEVCDAADNNCDTQVDEGFDNDEDTVTTCGPDGIPDTSDDDCDDFDADNFPLNDEVCDVADNDCDTQVDEGFDNDEDNVTTCGPDGIPNNSDDDCDDNDADNHPFNPEVCDAADNNCDTQVDEGFDEDEDTVTTCGPDGIPDTSDDDCDDSDADNFPLNAEICDAADNDCDTQVDEGFDNDEDSVTTCGPDGIPETDDDDCDDSDADNFPLNPEVCDAADNDCDTQVDEGFDDDEDGVTTCGPDGVPGNDDDDCDDDDENNFPGNLEMCDGADNNCNLLIDDSLDNDGDGVAICGPDGIPGNEDDDCDDTDAENFPGNDEVCDGADNNCDNQVDEGFDGDGDGVTSCGLDGTPGTDDDDCNDGAASVFPGNAETCDGLDNDCDTLLDEGFDSDSDGVTSCGPDGIPGNEDDDCDNADAANFPGNDEVCDGFDNNCDNQADEGYDSDSDGVTTCGPDGAPGNDDDDCDDADADSYPENDEVCDGLDNDCDGNTDEGFDEDEDGVTSCGPDGIPGNGDDDCDDADADNTPGKTEVCDGNDNDCDGQLDEGFDVDGDGVTTCGPDGVPGNEDDDCDDTDGDSNPGNAEVCDGVDNDCDGQTDEGFDVDQDGVTTCGPDGIPGNADDDCDDDDPDNYPGNSETCDEVDNNCDDEIDEGLSGTCGEPDTDTEPADELTEEEELCGPEGCVATGGTCACTAVGQTGGGGSAPQGLGLLVLLLGFFFVRRARRSEKKTGLLPFLLAICMLTPSLAEAEDTKVDVQTFKPSPFMNDLYNIYLGDTREEKLAWSAGLYLNYQHDPLVMRASASGEVVSRVIAHQLSADLLAALSILDWWEIGLGVPMHLFQDGEGFPDQKSPASFAMGDLRIHMKFRLFKTSGGLFSLAFAPYVTFPVGVQMDQFAGSNGITFVPNLAGSFHFKRSGIALNVGYLLLKSNGAYDISFDDQLLLRLGAWVWILKSKLQAIVELNAATVVTAAFHSLPETPIEMLLGGRFFPGDWIHLNLGFGTGITTGYAVPDFRMFAGVVVTMPEKKVEEPRVRDRDGDGLIDSEDQCPDQPEDVDQFEDEDGCPDLDNDQDGVLDTNDKCPDEAEDRDEFEDEDGCPDPDNDQDGILDTDDKCPDEAEDRDEFEDEDGCPDPDNDQDGILDEKDKCPLEPETQNGVEDDDGCPDTKVVVTEEKIIILDKIYFKHDSSTIEEESFSLLDDVVDVLKNNPGIEKLRIEGHTDSTGKKRYNMRLSKGRAGSVLKYLVNKGIDNKRLVSRGYGPTRPVVKPEKTDADREKNRRVEFVIVKRSDAVKPAEE